MHIDRDIKLDFKDVLIRPKRSACTYVGARTLKEFTKRTTFVRVGMESNELFGEN